VNVLFCDIQSESIAILLDLQVQEYDRAACRRQPRCLIFAKNGDAAATYTLRYVIGMSPYKTPRSRV
jgi:hypothetical protein